MQKQITVAIITRNRDKLLAKCLASLEKQTLFPSEVLVIDNSSTDETKQVVLSFRKTLPIRYIHEFHVGIPFARNRALKEASGDIIAFLDDDCEATVTWVEEMDKAHQKYPKAAAIQGSTLSQPQRSTFSIIWQNLYDLWIKKNTLVKNRLFIIDSKNVSFKRIKLKKAELEFDVNFNRGSDVDFAKQLIAQNLKIVYYPSAIIYHSERRNVFSFFYQKYQTGRSQAKFEAKWPTSFFPKITQKYANSYKKMFNSIGANLPILRRLVLKILLALYLRAYKIGYLSIKNHTPSDVTQAGFQIRREKRSNNIISVAIVTRNRYNQLKECLNSFIKQTVYPKEIIVIDNASTDLTREIVTSFKNSLPINYFYEPRIGIPFARNRALRETQGEILAFLDDDCEATPNWVEEMGKAHQKYPKAAAIQGESYALPKSNIFSIISQEFHHHWLNQNLIGQNQLAILDTRNTSLKVSELKNANISFDNSLNHVEDADLGRQLFLKNKIIIYYPNAEVFFLARTNFIQFLKHRFWVGAYNVKLVQKWPDMNNVWRKKPSKLFLINIRGYKAFFILIIKFLAKYAYTTGYIISEFYHYYRFERLQFTPKHEENYSTNRIFRLSVMIITKDRTTLLKRCVQSLIKQTRIPNEVIIVDSSKEKVYSSFEEFKKYLPIKYIYEQKLGFGIARNTALKNATGDILATIDDDGEATSDWCENIVKAHLQNPKTLAIQGRIISKPLTSPWAFVEQIRMDRWFLDNLDWTGQIRTMSTKNVSFKLKRFRKLKLNFSTLSAFNTFGAEDIDMARQILLAKEVIIFSTSVSVYHWERPTLISYLKQQYRKGCSNSLLAEWLREEKQLSRLSLPKVMQPILELTQHPLTRGNILRIIQLLPIYYLSLIFFQRGLDQKIVKAQAPTATKQKRADSFVVGIITRNRAQSLRRTLSSLESQTVLPTEVIVVDNKSSDNTKEVAMSFKITLKIKYCYEKEVGIPYARNRVLKEAQGEILAFLDDDCEASSAWVEKMLEGHKKYPDAAVLQGMSISKPSDRLLSIIAQFNRQTWVRDNMIGDRNSYWELVYGAKEKGVDVTYCEPYNLSVKVAKIRQRHVQFDEEFAQQLLSEDERIIFYPKAVVYHDEKQTIPQFLHESFLTGRTLGIAETRWPPEYFSLIKKSTVERAISFLYFCMVHKYFFHLPALLFLFLLYQQAFNKGKHAEVMDISP